MIDFHKELKSALEKILPTYYELALTSGTRTPCISYQERNNFDTDTGDSLGYSRLVYTVKVWGNEIATIQNYVKQIDSALRPIGFKRTSSQELFDYQSTMIQKILTYEAFALETY